MRALWRGARRACRRNDDFANVIRRDSSRPSEAQRQLAAARWTLTGDITADQFDPQQVQQAFAARRTASNRFFDEFSTKLVDVSALLPAEDRRKLVAERRMIHP